MTAFDHLRSLSARSWVLGGAGGLVAILLVVTIVAAGGSTADDPAGAAPPSNPTTPSSAADGPDDRTADTIRPAKPPSNPSSTSTSGSSSTSTTIDLDGDYEIDFDEDDPAVSARPIPVDPPADEPPPITLAPPPWAASTFVTPGGHVSTDVGCADDLSTAALDRFFAERLGPVLGWDYQHVYALGDDRYLWLFQDAFVDHSGTAATLGRSRFVHNAGLLQSGTCFSLLHRGTTTRPAPFEEGDGTGGTRSKWYWPMGGELVDGQLWVFWAEMVKDPYDPDPPDGLGWHPARTMLAAYDAVTLERQAFFPAANDGVTPIYGYAVSSDERHTYLFGNTFEQNLVREGGFWNGPHSATEMFLARVPLGRVATPPEYRTADGWSPSPDDAVPIVSRFWVENPMQPRYLDGQWVSAAAVDGYWGDLLAVDVADEPWGPWITVAFEPLLPRGADPKMNTYHAHPLPWRDGFGSVIITVSNNARNMLRDAWPNPHRYRPMVVSTPYTVTPAPPTTTTTTTTTTPTTTTTTTTVPTTTTTTTVPPTTTTTTTPPTTTTTTTPPTTTPPTTTNTTTTTTVPPSTSTTTTSTTTTTTQPPG